MNDAIAKPLPADAESERAVLGGILYGHIRAFELLDMLRPEDFQNEANQKVFKSVRRLSESGTSSDILAVSDDLTKAGELEAAGGMAYLSTLLDSRDVSVDLPRAARRVRRLAQRRKLIHTLDDLQKFAFDTTAYLDELLDGAIERLSNQARDMDESDDMGISHFDAATRKLSELKEGARLKIFTGVDKLAWTACS